MAWNTQLGSHTATGFRKMRKFIKKITCFGVSSQGNTSKKARAEGKRLMEDAPPRAIKGWAS